MRKLQKTEVRIGNYFIFVDSFDCRENDDINQISESDFDDSDFMWDRKLPLEISQSILKKFGFKLNEDTSIWHFGCYQVYENDLGHFEFCFFRYGEWQQPIEYAHELQNLYFCLSSGEELFFFN